MEQRLTIPGDPRLAEHIRQVVGRGALGHAVILSGQGDLLQAARFTAAAMECEDEDKPCGTCSACRKVLQDIHPDVITVQDSDHKNLSMDTLRQVRSNAYILPNEGRRKVYLFPDCHIFDPKTQNVLLKVLEEGPAYLSFIFCATNSTVLLQTIRSRCIEWKLAPVAAAAPTDEQARTLCQLLSSGKSVDIVSFCTRLENSKLSREELQHLLSDARDLLCRALTVCYGAGTDDALILHLAQQLGRHKLSAAADILQQFTRHCGYNIGVGHLTGALAVALSR